ncbi:MAG TPA: extracellular solute-binding protein [Xanthobacteraceae bacterium]|nr:extracellular solute-binding protein [Xanthobacteraceae bacterium]
MRLSRRTLLRNGMLAAAAPALGRLGQSAMGPAVAQGAQQTAPGAAAPGAPQWQHGLSLFDELRYPAGFQHFDYVNPNAPKGGVVRQLAIATTFDNFNPVVGAVKGTLAIGSALTTEGLMTAALDEVSTMYGLLAEAVAHPPDFSFAIYRLRTQARWHDGQPVTAEDVIFSFDAEKKYNPQLGAYYRHVTKAEKTGEHEVTFTFDGPDNRELPQIVGELPVFPKHWWEGTDASGKKRDIGATTLEPPLGSGPYRIKEFVAGRSITYERVKDYWGRELNAAIGHNNFDEVRYEYFRDSTVALEAFKGDQVDWRIENVAKNWATAYDFPAVRDKRVVLEEFPISDLGIMQAFVFNTRRPKFADARLRRAFNFAFDFDEMNKQLFFGQYHRITSYFDGTELASSGLPEGIELDILNTVRDQVPPKVFTTPYTNPSVGSPEKVRANLIEATRLLKESGYEIRDRKLVNVKTGEPLSVEMLIDDPTFERIVLFYKPQLERLGIAVTVRTVEDAQYENRLRQWNYDIIIQSWGQSLSPGNEQRGYWGSAAADMPGSQNYAGIKNPAIDKLIERIVFTKNRADLVAAAKALDRVLLWNNYVVPQWTYGKVRTARWDRFRHPDVMPKYGRDSFPAIWWWDEASAAKTGSRQ